MAANANYAILNPLTKGTASVLSGGNLIHDGNTTATATVQSSLGVNSGKWYCEVYINTLDASAPLIGIGNGMEDGSQSVSEGQFIVLRYATGNSSAWLSFATDGGSHPLWGTYSENEANLAQYSSGNILMMALDVDNKKLWFGKNGTWYNSGSPADNDGNWQQSWTGTPGHIHFATQTYNNAKDTWNFGQDDTFGGVISATGNADGNGFGVFKYSPPSGFLALCSANLPISDDIDPAQTDDDYPSKQFNTVTYTGTGSTQSITGLNFQPDLLWLKCRSIGQSARLIDSTRGVSKTLTPADTQNEQTESNGITSFDSDGFTIGSATGGFNTGSATYVAWAWRANGGTTATNSEGNHDCTLQANAKAGFSIMTLANYTSSSGVTLGHGLDTAPSFYIHKPLGNSKPWHVYHSGIGATKALILNTTAAEATAIGYFANTEPTADVLSLGNTFAGTGNGIVYAWAEVEGYSKFGSYVGNGNNDGPFIYTGFRPRLFVQKRIDSTGDWRVWDSARHTFNPNDAILRWDTDGAEDTANASCDFLSNGVKLRVTYADVNADGGDYIYMCWGDVPFKYNNTF